MNTLATPDASSAAASSPGMMPAAEHDHVGDRPLAQQLDHAREEGQVRARQHRQPDGVGVLLEGRLGDLLRGLVQTRVDHLEPGVAQCPGDDLGATIVAVEAGLGDDDAVAPLHGRHAFGRRALGAHQDSDRCLPKAPATGTRCPVPGKGTCGPEWPRCPPRPRTAASW